MNDKLFEFIESYDAEQWGPGPIHKPGKRQLFDQITDESVESLLKESLTQDDDPKHKDNLYGGIVSKDGRKYAVTYNGYLRLMTVTDISDDPECPYAC